MASLSILAAHVGSDVLFRHGSSLVRHGRAHSHQKFSPGESNRANQTDLGLAYGPLHVCSVPTQLHWGAASLCDDLGPKSTQPHVSGPKEVSQLIHGP
jgi:hypothetical protein